MSGLLLLQAEGWMPVAMEALRLDMLGRLLLATLLGGAIGWEREASGKPAGLRTNILICVGAALLTDLSIEVARLNGPGIIADPARIAAQIVSGIGFLGAGTIIQARGNVVGLTTAATLWVVAAIGMAVGAGAYVEAIGGTFLVIITLFPLARLEDRIELRRTGRTLHFVLREEPGVVGRVQRYLEEQGIITRVLSVEKDQESGIVIAHMESRGPEPAFRSVRAELLALEEVRGLTID